MPGHAAAAQFQQAAEHFHGGQELLAQLGVGQVEELVELGQLAGAGGHRLRKACVQRLELGILGLGQGQQALVFKAQLALFQGLADDQQQFVVVPRLGDVAVNFAPVDGIDGGCHIGVTRQQQSHGVGPICAHLLQKLCTVHAGHAHVRHHQRHFLCGQQREPFGTTGGGQHRVAGGAQQAPQRREDAGLVINQ